MSPRQVLTGLLAALLATALAAGTRVRIETDLGAVDLELADQAAPATVKNFLRYVDAGRYTGGVFHRTVKVRPDNQPKNTIKIEVVQGGVNPEHAEKDWPAVPLERTRDTGLRHVDGAISMARDGPDTATSDFFLCIGDQPELDFGGHRNPDGQGFAAFGRVVAGQDVVRRVLQAPAEGQKLTPAVRIVRIVRLP